MPNTTRNKKTSQADPQKKDASRVHMDPSGFVEGKLSNLNENKPRNNFIFGLQRNQLKPKTDEALWEAIKTVTESLSFNNYNKFMEEFFYKKTVKQKRIFNIIESKITIPFTDADCYKAVKVATEAFVMVNCQLEKKKLNRRLNGEISLCFIELFWNYWIEESMMVQGLNEVCRRFQNIRINASFDPLANIEIDPLRSLNNLLWGYIQDEQHRLTVRRRAYEYDHHYGITLNGNAVKGMRSADSRSKFVEAFHNLLNICIRFYKQYDDTTVVPDGFPVFTALKEVHLILSEGAHNQFGDLPSTARVEMLMQQFLLARPEFREFLPTRQMVPNPEPWMDRTAVLNQICGWTDTNVMHYNDLGIYGEQLLLSIRYGTWTNNDVNEKNGADWAIFWRSAIQKYIHAYRAVTGVDLS